MRYGWNVWRDLLMDGVTCGMAFVEQHGVAFACLLACLYCNTELFLCP